MNEAEIAVLAELAERAAKAAPGDWKQARLEPRAVIATDPKGDITLIAAAQDDSRSVYHLGNEYFVLGKKDSASVAAHIATASPSTIKRLIASHAALRAENERMGEALGFYAMRRNYDALVLQSGFQGSAVQCDDGQQARAALSPDAVKGE